MPKFPSSTLLLIAALLPGCAAQVSRPAAPAPAPVPVPAALTESRGSYVLDRPLVDFYDSQFVLSRADAVPRPIGVDELAGVMAGYDVVFYGESHGHDGVHLQEMKLLAALYREDPHWVLSLEQFERDVQDVVDDYLAGRVGENALLDKGHAWDNYTASYRPLVLFAKEQHLPVVAAEAPGWTITCIGELGTPVLDKFTAQERAWVAAEVHTADGPYRDKFMKFMGDSPSHGGGGADGAARAERSFTAQAARDDTMAESIEAALQNHPGYKLLHITGSFHSAGFLGTVERLRLRDPGLKIAVIEPLAVADPRVPAFAKDELATGTVLQLIYPVPEDFLAGEDTHAMLAHMAHQRELHRCKYAPAAGAAPAAPHKLPPGHPRVRRTPQ